MAETLFHLMANIPSFGLIVREHITVASVIQRMSLWHHIGYVLAGSQDHLAVSQYVNPTCLCLIQTLGPSLPKLPSSEAKDHTVAEHNCSEHFGEFADSDTGGGGLRGRKARRLCPVRPLRGLRQPGQKRLCSTCVCCLRLGIEEALWPYWTFLSLSPYERGEIRSSYRA